MLRRNFRFSYIQWRYLSQQATKTENKKRVSRWESVIGLEIHAQINSKSKLFSGAATNFAAPINSQVSYMDAALPGTLPVLNKRCVEAAVITALALNCHINMVSKFDRKHYFYADLPAGFQITQQRMPIATNGHLDFRSADPKKPQKLTSHSVRITQVQLEQDSGKSLHDIQAKISLIDLNRAGVGLMEIVTEPDFRSSQEAAAFVRELQLILTTLGTCDGKMDEGSLRVDASISLRQPNEPLGVRAEVKNINSVRFVSKAIEYEIQRQAEILENGGEVTNETRSFDFETETTIAMRDKEKVHDYRFLPEPNLPPLVLYNDHTVPASHPGNVVNVDQVKRAMPELPEATRQRLVKQHKISMEHAIILVNDPPLRTFFEDIVAMQTKKNPKMVLNLLLNEIMALLNKNDIDIASSPISNEAIVELLQLVEDGIISKSMSKKVLDELLKKPSSPREVVEANDWFQITDAETISRVCDAVVQGDPESVKEYRKGNDKIFKFFMGQVQKATRGRVEPRKATTILKEKLDRLKG